MPKESENIKISSIIARKSAQNDNSKWLKLDLHATETAQQFFKTAELAKLRPNQIQHKRVCYSHQKKFHLKRLRKGIVMVRFDILQCCMEHCSAAGSKFCM